MSPSGAGDWGLRTPRGALADPSLNERSSQSPRELYSNCNLSYTVLESPDAISEHLSLSEAYSRLQEMHFIKTVRTNSPHSSGG